MRNCCCFPNWKQYRFKSQLQIGFSLLSGIAVSCIFIMVVVFTVVMTAQQEDRLRSRLTTAAADHTEAIAKASAEVFDATLARNAANFLSPLGYTAAADWTRVDYPYAPQASYYEWRDLMPQPSAYDARYNSIASFVQSGYSVGKQNPYIHAPTWTMGLNQTVQRTESLSPLMKVLYQRNKEFLSGYVCYANGNVDGTASFSPSMSVFREYPSVSNGNFTQMTAYDCTRDNTWYLEVANVNRIYATGATPVITRPDRQAQFTSVYYDAWVRQTMITIVQPLFHPVSGSFIGVVGGDLLTETLQQSIAGVRYLTNGRAVLFEINLSDRRQGVVIADTARNAAIPQTRLQQYHELHNPDMTESLWSQCLVTDDKNKPVPTFVEIDDWYLASRSLETGGNQYLLVVMVFKSDVLQPLVPVIADVVVARRTAIILNCCLSVTVLVFFMVMTLFLAQRVVAPIQKLTDDSVKLVEQIGQDDLGSNLVIVDPNSGIAETRQLQEAHRSMLLAIQAQCQANEQAATAAAAAAYSQQGKITYALPAYFPLQPFDQSMLIPTQCMSPSQSLVPLVPHASHAPPPYAAEVSQGCVQVHLSK